ncbi:MAG: hypothetical protein R3D80_15430 [Paracoccaceae bacterium]
MVSKLLKQFRKDETGAAMVEYAIALLVAASIGVLTFTTMGGQAAKNAEKACDALMGSTTNTACDAPS